MGYPLRSKQSGGGTLVKRKVKRGMEGSRGKQTPPHGHGYFTRSQSDTGDSGLIPFKVLPAEPAIAVGFFNGRSSTMRLRLRWFVDHTQNRCMFVTTAQLIFFFFVVTSLSHVIIVFYFVPVHFSRFPGVIKKCGESMAYRLLRRGFNLSGYRALQAKGFMLASVVLHCFPYRRGSKMEYHAGEIGS